MLRDVSCRDWRTTLLDTPLPAPGMLAPLGVQGIMHPDGELGTARAAASLGIPVILSSASSVPLEEVAAAMGDAPRWFQLYWSSDADVAASFLARAGRAGYRAIVVTVDCPILSWRERDLANAYSPFLHGHGIANYFSDPVFRSKLARPPEQDPGAAIRRFAETFGNASLTWDDLPFLRRHSPLPIVLKGILSPDDAARAVDAGVDGIVVSNHGGRQVDGAVGSLDALPRVVERVAGRIPVLFDGGIRRGADAFKALALGAKAVLLGRLYGWALALAGEAGVREALLNFLADLDLTLGLAGCTTPADLGPGFLRREG
jgi:isopentenyl diphosphate isomerase/L-lactate dehydrogenase-like FMN-dependent dehydrogenase